MADDVIGKLIFKVETDTAKAQKGVEEFNDEMKDTQKEAQKAEKQINDSGSKISAKWIAVAAAVGAAVVKLAKEIAEATNEIQEGQQTIVNATGATGEALEGLMESAKKVYSQNEEEFEDVAKAIGEINTRLGYTGQKLEDTTELFLDFADVTEQDVQQAIVGVTKAINRWGMDAENIPEVLDKLTYAGQASGISVEQLTTIITDNAGTLQAMGYSLDEAISMMMQFELQGIDSSSVIMGMKKSFEESAKAGTDARSDWEALLASITNATDETEANSIAIGAFGNRIATDMVTALQSGKLNFDEFTGALENANGVLKATDEAGKTTGERIETLKHTITLALASVGEKLAPVIENILPQVADLLIEVLDELNPLVPVISEFIKSLLPPIITLIKLVISTVTPIINAVLPTLTSLLRTVGTVISSIAQILTPFVNILSGIVEKGMSLVNSVLKPVLDVLNPIIEVLTNITTTLLQPLIAVIETVLGWIEKLVGGIQSIFDWFSKLLGLGDDAKAQAQANYDALSDQEKAQREYEKSSEGWKMDYGYVDWDYDEGHPLLSGSRYIPYDNYRANLHKGEIVLNRADSARFRELGGLYGLENMAFAPVGLGGVAPISIDNQLTAVLEVDGTQLGIAVLKNIDNASQFVLR